MFDKTDYFEGSKNNRRSPDVEAGSNDAGAARLTPPAFLRRVVAEMTKRGGLPGRDLQCLARGGLAKFWYGEDSSIHYEIWVHERTAQLELGLHCESTAKYNRTLYTAFDHSMLEIQSALGDSFWLEEWDHGWIRLYETHPLHPLDPYRVDEIAARLNEIISTLQPLYDHVSAELGGPPQPPPERQRNQSRWRK